ncbi:YbjQ family protein [Paraconexibacter sp.]|uniref:YbjQ family protein n=1 Tax=Paraconexibacter sp. TaxID=2949640 RepID=UPI0035651353
MSDASHVALSTTPTLPGHEVVAHLGVVAASTVLAPTTWLEARSLGRTVLGGRVRAHVDLTDAAIVDAVERLRADARASGANAVVGLSVEPTQLRHCLLVIVSGTAVSVTETAPRADADA